MPCESSASLISSPASEASASDSSAPAASKPSRSARLRTTPAASSPSTGHTSPATTMSAPSQPMLFDETELPSTGSLEDSPVRTFRSLEMELASTVSDQAWSERCFDSFASYDPKASCWRTHQRSFIKDLTEYSGGWPRSGMMRNGIAFELPALEPHSKETASTFLPRPTRSMGKRGWGFARPSPRGRYSSRVLNIALQFGWRPPVDLLEWAMGFPIGWTAANELSAAATRSSLRSPSSSAARSCKRKG